MRKGSKWLLCGQGPDLNTPRGEAWWQCMSTSIVCTYIFVYLSAAPLAMTEELNMRHVRGSVDKVGW